MKNWKELEAPNKTAELEEIYNNCMIASKYRKLEGYKEILYNYIGDNLSQKLFNALNNINEFPKCKSCDKTVKFKNFSIGYKQFCSVKCAQCSDITRSKMKNTLLEKYGTTDPFEINEGRIRGLEKCNNNEEIALKRKETCLKVYGGETSFHSSKTQDKVKDSVKLKYGVDNVFQNEEIKLKIRNVNEESGYWLKEENIASLDDYRKIVWAYTRAQNLESLSNYYKRGHIMNEDTYHIDHKFSIKQGYMDNIKPHIIGNIANLEMLPAIDNIKKKNKCSITIEELLSKIKGN